MALTKVSRGLLSTGIVDNSNATAITIDSSENVGIGTSSPGVRAHVNSNASGLPATSGTTQTNGVFRLSSTATSGIIDFGMNGTNPWIQSTGSDGLGATYNLLLNPNGGNVGIGTSSSTVWNGASGTKLLVGGASNTITSLQSSSTAINQGGIFEAYATAQTSGTNAIGSISFLRENTSVSAISGFAAFYTSSSGAVAERMRIDSSGNVGIGTSSPTAKLHLNSASTTAIMFDSDTSTQQYELGIGYGGVGTSSFYLYDNTANAARLVVNSTGNVGIGSSPSNLLHLHNTAGDSFIRMSGGGSLGVNYGGFVRGYGVAGTGGYLDLGVIDANFFRTAIQVRQQAAEIIFKNGDTERMRLSGGKLLIGTTSTLRTNESLHVDGPEGIVARGTANGGAAIVGLEASGNSQGYTFAALNTSGAVNFAVKVGGAIHSTSTSITGISDERAKENIRDLEIGLEEIIQLKPRRFDWKEGKGSNTKDSIGFIAQEVEQIGGFEVILSEWNDPDIEDAKALKMGDMLPVLVKSIQEQQATIEALTQRIETLENT